MKLIWNGGFELDWKAVASILGFVFLVGGGWYKLNAMETAFSQHVIEASLREHSLWSLVDSMKTMEKRIDYCCPFSTITPKDMAPPGRPGGVP